MSGSGNGKAHYSRQQQQCLIVPPHLCVSLSFLADLIRMIMKDAKNFDTRAWIVAVGIVLSAFVVLSLGICIVLYKEWQEEEDEDLPGMKHRPTHTAHQVGFLLLLSYFLLLTIIISCGSFLPATTTHELRGYFAFHQQHHHHPPRLTMVLHGLGGGLCILLNSS